MNTLPLKSHISLLGVTGVFCLFFIGLVQSQPGPNWQVPTAGAALGAVISAHGAARGWRRGAVPVWTGVALVALGTATNAVAMLLNGVVAIAAAPMVLMLALLLVSPRQFIGAGLVMVAAAVWTLHDGIPTADRPIAVRSLAVLIGALMLGNLFNRIARHHRLERAKNEASLREGAAELRALLDAFPGYIAATDEALRYTYVNDRLLAVWGRSREATVGRTVREVLGVQRAAAVEEAIHLALRGEPSVAEAQFKVGAAETRLVMEVTRVASPRQVDGRQTCYAFGVDITARKLAEESLIAARDDAESANRAKSMFLSHMSHEIRTPLNAVIGTAYLLGQSDLSQGQRADLRTIEASSKNLLGLINDVLDFSKIEAGELMLDRHPFALADVFDDLRAMFDRQAADKGLTLCWPDLVTEPVPVLVGDANRLRQCLINLVGNAIKFTERGEVAVNVLASPAPELGAAVNLRFQVRDTGLGLTEAQAQQLFAPFVQADASTARRFGGSGLGLSIVKRLASMMGGQVGVTSTLGVGSVFWLELPLSVGTAITRPEPGHAGARALRLLVAESEPSDQADLLRLAKDFGWEFDAVTGARALADQIAAHGSAGSTIDGVLIDWRQWMDRHGDVLRDGPPQPKAPALPVVVMATPDECLSLLAAGDAHQPDGVLIKPIQASTLFNALTLAYVAQGLEADHVLSHTSVRSELGQWLPGVQVLVVDDSRLNLDVVGRILAHEGAVPTLRESGMEALAALRDAPSAFDLVLMDLQMPALDGCETTQRIRASGLHDLPVVALTAGATTTEALRAREAGMDGLLTKPIDPAQLVRVVRQHVNRRRAAPLPLNPRCSDAVPAVTPFPAAQAGRTAPTASHDAAPHKRSMTEAPSVQVDPSGWPQLPDFDMRQATRLMGTPAFFRMQAARFAQEQASAVFALTARLDAAEPGAAATEVHKLSGQAAMLGATALHAAAAALEHALLGGNAELTQAVADFAAAHRTTLGAINAWLAIES